MLFTSTGYDKDGNLTGHAVETPGSPTNVLCQRYNQVSAELANQDSDRVRSVVVADPWPFSDAPIQQRRLFHLDDLPRLAQALGQAERRPIRDEDVVVLIPEATVSRYKSANDIIWMAVLDLSGWAVETSPERVNELLWAAPAMTRAVVAARLLRGAEGAGLMDVWDAAVAYREVCSATLSALTEGYDENGESLLTLESPGLIGFLHRMVEQVRLGPPPALPLDLYDEAENARTMLRQAST